MMDEDEASQHDLGDGPAATQSRLSAMTSSNYDPRDRPATDAYRHSGLPRVYPPTYNSSFITKYMDTIALGSGRTENLSNLVARNVFCSLQIDTFSSVNIYYLYITFGSQNHNLAKKRYQLVNQSIKLLPRGPHRTVNL